MKVNLEELKSYINTLCQTHNMFLGDKQAVAINYQKIAELKYELGKQDGYLSISHSQSTYYQTRITGYKLEVNGHKIISTFFWKQYC